eukprot:9180242-Pyramimonas_sp.AAC.1
MCHAAWHSSALGRARLPHHLASTWGGADASRLFALRQCADERMHVRGWPRHQDYFAVHPGSAETAAVES